MDTQNLAHSKWNCKCHIVLALKFRRKAIYGNVHRNIGVILRKLREKKGAEIIEAKLCPDHVHVLVSIPPEAGCSLD